MLKKEVLDKKRSVLKKKVNTLRMKHVRMIYLVIHCYTTHILFSNVLSVVNTHLISIAVTSLLSRNKFSVEIQSSQEVNFVFRTVWRIVSEIVS